MRQMLVEEGCKLLTRPDHFVVPPSSQHCQCHAIRCSAWRRRKANDMAASAHLEALSVSNVHEYFLHDRSMFVRCSWRKGREGNDARSAPALPGTSTAGSRAMLLPSLAARWARLCFPADERAPDCGTLSSLSRGSKEQRFLNTLVMQLTTARRRPCLCTWDQPFALLRKQTALPCTGQCSSEKCVQVNVEVEHAAGADDER